MSRGIRTDTHWYLDELNIGKLQGQQIMSIEFQEPRKHAICTFATN